MVSDYIIKELNYNVTDVRIAYDDKQIEAHKMFEESCNRYRHPDTDSGMLLQIQAFCYKQRQFVFKASVFQKDGWLKEKNGNIFFLFFR